MPASINSRLALQVEQGQPIAELIAGIGLEHERLREVDRFQQQIAQARSWRCPLNARKYVCDSPGRPHSGSSSLMAQPACGWPSTESDAMPVLAVSGWL